MKVEEIEQNVIKWAMERGFLHSSNIDKQFIKLVEEVGETGKAINNNDKDEIIDGIGDCLVVLTNLANMIDMDLTSCFYAAWTEIKDRKGITKDGVFQKESK